MKPTSRSLALLLALASGVCAQGPLNPPPGVPAPTMKTLEQLEPRTPVSLTTTPGTPSAIFKITQPGSYYLTGNLVGESGKNGIEIAAAGVTLDLMGFELRGAQGTGIGVAILTPQTNIVVRNGSIRSWSAGVNAANAINSVFERLVVAGNATAGLNAGSHSTIIDSRAYENGTVGINSNGRSVVTRCSSDRNTGAGITVTSTAVITDCTAAQNGGHGFEVGYGGAVTNCSAFGNTGVGFKINATSLAKCSATDNAGGGIAGGVGAISDCSVVGQNSGIGIKITGGRVTGCIVEGVTGNGVEAGYGSQISDCTVRFNIGNGIVVDSGCSVINNTTDGHNLIVGTPIGSGIFVSGSGNRIDSNHTQGNDHGIRITGANNMVIRNTARANGAGNYTIGAGNESALIVVNPGTNFNNSNPWANYAF